MRIKVLMEKKSFKQSSSPAKRSSVVQHERDQNDGDVQSESAEKPCLFRAQLEQTSTGKAVSCVDIGNIVNNSRL